MFCFYLGSLISYRKVFVLQTDLWIPPFKWTIPQPSIMSVAREKSKNCGYFFGHPVNFEYKNFIKRLLLAEIFNKQNCAFGYQWNNLKWWIFRHYLSKFCIHNIKLLGYQCQYATNCNHWILSDRSNKQFIINSFLWPPRIQCR